jgi:hypothetical protein
MVVAADGPSFPVYESVTRYPTPSWAVVSQLNTLVSFDTWAGGNLTPSCATDGHRIAIGFPEDDQGGLNAGAVYVFVRAGGNWAFEQKLWSLTANPGGFGAFVAIDGDRLAAGPVTGYPGVVEVYALQGGTWTFETALGHPGSIAMTSSRVVVGDELFGFPANATGRAWVYERSGTAWALSATLTTPDLIPGDRFGCSVALDGDFVAVGNRASNVTVQGGGAVYLYRNITGAWFPEVRFSPSDLYSGASFGAAIGMFDRNVYCIGSASGSVYAFCQSGSPPFTNWTQTKKLSTSLAQSMGAPLSYDGQSLVVKGSQSVAIVAYQIPAVPAIYCTAKVNSQGCTPSIAASGSISFTEADSLTIAATSVLPGAPGVMIWSRSAAAIPFLGGTLCLGTPLSRTPTQFAGGVPGDPCSGAYSYLMTHAELSAAGVVAGSSVYAQYYSRDNGYPMPQNIGLTDAVHIVMRP